MQGKTGKHSYPSTSLTSSVFTKRLWTAISAGATPVQSALASVWYILSPNVHWRRLGLSAPYKYKQILKFGHRDRHLVLHLTAPGRSRPTGDPGHRCQEKNKINLLLDRDVAGYFRISTFLVGVIRCWEFSLYEFLKQTLSLIGFWQMWGSSRPSPVLSLLALSPCLPAFLPQALSPFIPIFGCVSF